MPLEKFEHMQYGQMHWVLNNIRMKLGIIKHLIHLKLSSSIGNSAALTIDVPKNQCFMIDIFNSSQMLTKT